MKDMLIASYWGPRRETREACAQRLFCFMSDLVSFHPFLSGWGKASGSPKKPPILIDPTIKGVSDALSMSNNEITGNPIVELGFILLCHNEHSAEIIAELGHFSQIPPNNKVLLSIRESLITEAALWRKIALSAIRNFEPDELVVTNDAFIDKSGTNSPRKAGGWFTYKNGGELVENPNFMNACD